MTSKSKIGSVTAAARRRLDLTKMSDCLEVDQCDLVQALVEALARLPNPFQVGSFGEDLFRCHLFSAFLGDLSKIHWHFSKDDWFFVFHSAYQVKPITSWATLILF